MLLAIDAGNTNLVFALVDGGEIKARWRIATDPRRTADQYAVWLHQLLELECYSKADVDSAIIGTVVPRALHNLDGAHDPGAKAAGLREKNFHRSTVMQAAPHSFSRPPCGADICRTKAISAP